MFLRAYVCVGCELLDSSSPSFNHASWHNEILPLYQR